MSHKTAAKYLAEWMSPFASSPFFNFLIADRLLNDVRTDSRDIRPGDIFVALKGSNLNGLDFIESAIANGAVAVLADDEDLAAAKAVVQQHQVALVLHGHLKRNFHALLREFYDHAGRVKMVGVTGTNGKTTTTHLIAQLGQALQQRSGLIGTLGAGPLDNLQPLRNTTPGIADNYRLLDQFARNGGTIMAMEVSSAGQVQQRIKGLVFDTVVFTNLSQDHLDFHGDWETYVAAKKSFFDDHAGATTILNVDDAIARQWWQQWHGNRRLIAVGAFDATYATAGHVMFRDVETLPGGIRFTLCSSWGEVQMSSPLLGRFNLSNLVAALAVLLHGGTELSRLAAAVAELQTIAGRMEVIHGSSAKTGDEVVAVVDYAHTPDALCQALLALKAHCQGRLWCIFGCGGNRDKSKRPLMGEVAGRYADRVVLVNDNPRDEVPGHIIADIEAGIAVPDRDKVTVEPDRKRAIANTLKQAVPGDVILVAGKGHETYQEHNGERIDYDERAWVRHCVDGGVA